MAVGAVIAAVAGTLIAFLCLRYRLAGAYFALATFAFAQLFLLVVQNVDALGKTEGFNLPILPEDSFWMMQFESGSSELLLDPAGPRWSPAWRGHRRSPARRAGQRVARPCATTRTPRSRSGIRVMRYRLIPVAPRAAIISAVAGAYYTQYYFFVGPDAGLRRRASRSRRSCPP